MSPDDWQTWLRGFLATTTPSEAQEYLGQDPELIRDRVLPFLQAVGLASGDAQWQQELAVAQKALEAVQTAESQDLVASSAEDPSPPRNRDEATRWFSSLKLVLKKLLDYFDLGKPKESVWSGTSYPEVHQLVMQMAKGWDQQQLARAAEHHSGTARKAYDNGRPRRSVLHLQASLAFSAIAGDASQAASTVGNLALQYNLIDHHETALKLQLMALATKQALRARSSQLARSHHLIAESLDALGDYEAAREHIAKGHAICDYNPVLKSPTQPDNSLARVETHIAIREVIDSIADLHGTAPAPLEGEQAEDSPLQATWQAVEAISRAVAAGDKVAECSGRLELADLLVDPIRMFADAKGQYQQAGELAVPLGCEKRQFKAAVGLARASMAVGQHAEACGALDRALALPGLTADQRADTSAYLSRCYLDAGDEQLGNRYLFWAIEMGKRMPKNSIVWLHGQGITFRNCDFVDYSLRWYQAAIDAAEENPQESEKLPQLYHDAGRTQFLRDDFRAAHGLLGKSAAAARKLGDEKWLGWALAGLTATFLELGNLGEAQSHLEELQSLVKRVDDPGLSRSAFNLTTQLMIPAAGLLAGTMNGSDFANSVRAVPGSADVHRSLRNAQQQLDEALKKGDAERIPLLHSFVASQLERTGDFSSARPHHRQALKTARAAGMHEQFGMLLHDYGAHLAYRGKYHSAKRAFRVAMNCKDAFAEGQARLSSLMNYVQACDVLGALDELGPYVEQLQQALTEIDPRMRPHAQIILAQVHAQRGDLSEAIQVAESAIADAEQADDREAYLIGLQRLCEFTLSAEQHEAAVDWGQRALAECERQRAATLARYRAHSSQRFLPAIRAVLRAYFATDRTVEALGLVEHVKIRTLIERLGDTHLAPPESMSEELRAAEEEAIRGTTLSRLAQELSKSGDPHVIDRMPIHDDVKREQEEQRALHQFWSELPALFQEYGQLRRGLPLDGEVLLQKFAAYEACHLLAVYPSDQATFVWHVSPDGRLKSCCRHDLAERELASIVQEVLARISAAEPLPAALTEVSQRLFGEPLQEIGKDTPICFVPSGVFNLMPFSALPVDGRHLAHRNSVFILPSLSMLAYRGVPATTHELRHALVLGNSLNDLPAAEREAIDVAHALRDTPLLGSQVIRMLIQPNLGGCDILHVAGHSRYAHENPELAGIFLADGTTASARDLRDMRLRAELVVLSSCESGAVNTGSADELTGLWPSLLGAGARRVVGSLWKVSDEATRRFMEIFYERLLDGKTTCHEALCDAQQQLSSMSKYEHPYYWAAFQAWGQGSGTFRVPDQNPDHR